MANKDQELNFDFSIYDIISPDSKIDIVYQKLYKQKLDFFVKWIFTIIIIGIYVVCLVLFLKGNNEDKANMLLKYKTISIDFATTTKPQWYSFLFRTWYFVPILTLSFICLILFMYKTKFISFVPLFLIGLVLIFFTLSVYYSYNTIYPSSLNYPIIMSSLALFFTILIFLYFYYVRPNIYVLLLLPMLVMIGFGMYIGIKYTLHDFDSLVLPPSDQYVLYVKEV
jgi:hypothetical protein